MNEKKPKPEPLMFTVDTHLFRELGELLVGRDSTALIELIKNSYDADARRVVVYGEALSDPGRGSIKIIDDGLGMSREQFVNGFLRIASRTKEVGERRSPLYGRRYTGEKGVGRLAAHKLARTLDLESFTYKPGSLTVADEGIKAEINWDQIETFETLDGISSGVTCTSLRRSKNTRTGTTIVLRNLRRRWTPAELSKFVAEVQTFTLPTVLMSPPRSVARALALFDQPKFRDSTDASKAFTVDLEGEFAPSHEYWDVFAENADWLIEVDAPRTGDNVSLNIAPTARCKERLADAKRHLYSIPHPNPKEGPHFQARILLREGRLSAERKEERGWAAGVNGIRVYMEGFRVLPYGAPNDDWLALDADYTRRSRKIEWLGDIDDLQDLDPDAGLMALPNRNYFGAVFLTAQSAPSLKMLVNREGFVPDGAFERIREILRNAINVANRVRASASSEARRNRKATRGQSKSAEVSRRSPVANIIEVPKKISSLQHLTDLVSQLIAEGDVGKAKQTLANVSDQLSELGRSAEGAMTEAAMLRVLASVGTQMSAFVHEINGLLGMAMAVERGAGQLRHNHSVDAKTRREFSELTKSIGDFRRHLERHASYLMDVVSVDARRRRSRHNFHERFESAVRLLAGAAGRRDITIENKISSDLKSMPMFQAELITVFSNILSNAVKAAGEGGGVLARSEVDDSRVNIYVENTGTAVAIQVYLGEDGRTQRGVPVERF